MARKIVHRQIYKSHPSMTINTTMCGRVSNAADDLNVAGDVQEVTCKFCLKALANPKHYNQRWLNHEPA